MVNRNSTIGRRSTARRALCSSLGLSALALALLGASPSARAQEEAAQGEAQADPAAETSERHLEEGFRERLAQRFDRALVHFQRAFELFPSGRALAHVAATEALLEHWVEAERHLIEAFAEWAEDPYVQRNRAALEAALIEMQAHLGNVSVHGGAPGAEVLIDGVLRGYLPLAGDLRATVGAHHVEVRAPRLAFAREIELGAGLTVAVEAPEPAPEPEPLTPSAPVSDELREVFEIGGWSAAGVGGAAVLVGGILGIVTLNLDSIFRRDFNCQPDPSGAEDLVCDASRMVDGRTESRLERQAEVASFAAATDALLISGLLFGALGATLALTLGSEGEERSGDEPGAPSTSAQVSLRGGPAGFGLTLDGTW